MRSTSPWARAMSVRLDSADVLHEFWVPELARKITAVPGHPNHIWIEAGRTGNLSRRLLRILRDRARLDALSGHRGDRRKSLPPGKKPQLRPAAVAHRRPGREGPCAFRTDELRQLPRDQRHHRRGAVGPDLTHFASRRQIGAGIADNTPENLRRWLADPQQVKPGAKMPDFKFTDEQLTQLVAYFETLK